MFKTIHSRFICSYLICTALFLLILFFWAYSQAREKLLELTINNYLEISTLHAQKIGDALEKESLFLQGIAEQEAFKTENKKAILRELQHIRQRDNNLFSIVSFVNAKGDALSSDGNHSKVEQRYFLKELERGKTPTLSKPTREGISGTPVVTLGIPVKNSNGQAIGTIAAAINLIALADSLAKIHLRGNSYCWMIDQDGTILTHPNPNFSLQDVFRVTEAGFPDFVPIATNAIKTQKGFGRYGDTNLNKEKIVTYAKIPHTPGWTLFISAFEEDIFKSANKILTTAVITTVGLLLFFVFIIGQMTETITTPIKKLTQAVKRSAKRDFTPLSLPITDDEIGRLVSAYNDMTIKVRGYTHSLEDMVQKRTDELETLNKKLHEKNTKLLAINDDLFEMATQDKLTGLLNRHALDAALEKEINRSNRFKTATALLLLDLDHFKQVNDTHGHDVGDEILQYLASILKKSCRKTDILARWGGEEFIIIAPETTIMNARLLADSLRKKIMGKTLPETGAITVSIGVTAYRYDESVGNWFKRTDSVLYQAKASGRNKVVTDLEDLQQAAKSKENDCLLRIHWEDRFNTGIASIDAQHKELVNIANTIIDASISELERDAILILLEKLHEKTVEHFTTEEEFLEEYNGAVLEEHAQEHAEFIDALAKQVERYRSVDLGTYALLKFVCGNLVKGHMLDKDIVDFADVRPNRNETREPPSQ